MSLPSYTIPQTEVEALTGMNDNTLSLYFLSPNQHHKRLKLSDGRTLEVKRPWHGDEEMRGRFV